MCIATSEGGHVAEIEAVREAFAGFQRVWITGRSKQADALRAAGEEVCLLPTWGRDPPGLRGFWPNVRRARQLVATYRPRAVVTNGAGLVVPFVLMARLQGSRLIVIETMARVTSLSLSVKLLSPFSDFVLVQWPEVGRGRRTIVCRPAMLEGTAARVPPDGHGTFVSVGTRPEPFDRLLAIVDRAVGAGVLPKPVIAQSGHSSYRPANYETRPWMSPRQVGEMLESARYVICHGGSGMVAGALAAGRRPIVLARRRSAGEHRTEHQQQLVDKLAAEGAIVALHREIGRDELRRADRPLELRIRGVGGQSLKETLRDCLVSAMERR